MKREYGLFLFVLAAVLPVIILRDFTPSNELRYLSIADEALANGTFFTFTNQGIPYADKPPLYLWIVMLGKWLFGRHVMWFLSLFSLIPAFVIADVMNRWTRREIRTEEWRTASQMLLLTSGLFLGMAVVLRMDMLMCMFIVLSIHTFYKMEKGEGDRQKNAWLFPVYLFLALFTKGPVGILVPLAGILTYLLVTRRIRTFFAYWGWKTWGVLLAGCALWFGAVYLEGGYEYLDNLLFHQTIDRAVNSFHHEEPFYYYFIAIWYSLAPWSLLLVGVGVAAVARWHRFVRTDLQKLFFSVFVATFVVLSCISSKLQVYLIPAYPFLIYFVATCLPRVRWNRWLAASIAVPAAVLGLAVFALPFLPLPDDLRLSVRILAYVAAGILTLAVIRAFYLLYRRKQTCRTIQMVAVGLFCAVFVGGWALPQVNSEIGYRKLCKEAKKVAKEQGLDTYYTWKVSRPEGMDVYLHQDIRKLTEEEVKSGTLQPGILMLPKSRLDQFPGKEAHLVGKYAILIL